MVCRYIKKDIIDMNECQSCSLRVKLIKLQKLNKLYKLNKLKLEKEVAELKTINEKLVEENKKMAKYIEIANSGPQ